MTKNLTTALIAIAFLAVVPRLVWSIWRNRRLSLSGLGQADRMNGQEFEAFLLAKLRLAGYRGRLTPRTEDFGADLILEKDGEKIAVQAKRWDSTVGIEAVQQVVAAIRYYRADRGMVITNSRFGPRARELARSNGVELWDRKELERFLLSVAKDKAKQVPAPAMETSQVCPGCGSPMVQRKGRRGPFWGCVNCPDCTATLRD